MDETPLAVDRRSILKSAGVGIMGETVYSANVTAEKQNRDSQNTVPNIWLYDVSDKEHTFEVRIRKHKPSGKEVTFDRKVQLQPLGERKWNGGFEDSDHRYSALVRLDEEKQKTRDVTTVAKNVQRYSAVVTSRLDNSVSLGMTHLDPKEGR